MLCSLMHVRLQIRKEKKLTNCTLFAFDNSGSDAIFAEEDWCERTIDRVYHVSVPDKVCVECRHQEGGRVHAPNVQELLVALHAPHQEAQVLPVRQVHLRKSRSPVL